MSLIPQFLIEKKWSQSLSRLGYGTLNFVRPDGEEQVFRGQAPGPVACFRIHDWDVVRRAASRGDIALGEDYIAGAWDTDDIEFLFSLFLMNMDRLESYAHGDVLSRIGFVLQNSIVNRNSLSGAQRNIEAHYDVGNEFYRLWLDDTMTYSSALYAGEEQSLAGAQRRKYSRILKRAPKPNASVLEVGCGWGGFAEQAVAQAHHVTGITISPSQHRFASQRLGASADIRLEDYRKTRGLFDMIVSIEMFEAVGERYWPQYFRMVAERLSRNGRAVIQTITIRDELFAGYRTRSDFIRHYVFPGGMLPSLQRFCEEAERAGLKVKESFSFGLDYAKTLREWGERMRARESDILALGRDKRFLRNWEFYLGICAAAFAVGRTDVKQVELVHA